MDSDDSWSDCSLSDEDLSESDSSPSSVEDLSNGDGNADEVRSTEPYRFKPIRNAVVLGAPGAGRRTCHGGRQRLPSDDRIMVDRFYFYLKLQVLSV